MTTRVVALADISPNPRTCLLARARAIGVWILLWAGSSSLALADFTSNFGGSTRGESALIGIFYDLKQTPDHKPSSVNAYNYFQVVDEFLSKNWDESVLNNFYRASRPLYTTQIFIPNMDASAGPKAFGVDKFVQPSNWVVHYKGQVSAPSPGNYRFWGVADDLIAVAVNGKTEMAEPFGTNFNLTKWRSTDQDGSLAAHENLHAGDWFSVKQGEVIDLDVIIGERPGGDFNAFLLIEKQGETYPKGADSRPILPIFQVAPYETPVNFQLTVEPKFSTGFLPWKCLQ